MCRWISYFSDNPSALMEIRECDQSVIIYFYFLSLFSYIYYILPLFLLYTIWTHCDNYCWHKYQCAELLLAFLYYIQKLWVFNVGLKVVRLYYYALSIQMENHISGGASLIWSIKVKTHQGIMNSQDVKNLQEFTTHLI